MPRLSVCQRVYPPLNNGSVYSIDWNVEEIGLNGDGKEFLLDTKTREYVLVDIQKVMKLMELN